MGATDCPITQLSYERYNMYSISYELFHHPLNGVPMVFIDEELIDNTTRRLKSFPWLALVYGSIMAFYLNLEKLGNRKDVSCYKH